MSTIDPDKKIQKVRTEEEIRKALQNCIHCKVTMCVPPQMDDDDIVLYDAFKELKEARGIAQKILAIAQKALETPEVVNSEDPWTAILEIALEDIVKLCQEQTLTAEV